MMDGAFQEGDTLTAIVGPFNDRTGGTYIRVGEEGVTRISVSKAAGPMGWYAVAEVFKGDELVTIHPLHMMEIVVVNDGPY